MKTSKNTTSLIVVLTLIMVTSVLTLGVLLYVRGQSLTTLNSTNSSTVTSNGLVTTPPFTGDVSVSIVKSGVNKYNLVLDTKGSEISVVDLRFNISDDLATVIATKGGLTELNDLFVGKTENNELLVQAGTLNGYTGSGVLATLELSDPTSNVNPTLTLLSSSFVNAGSDLSINELSSTLVNYSFTLD